MASLVRNIVNGILGSRTVLHPRETQFEAGTLGAVDAEIFADCDGSGTVSLDLRGTFNMTVQVAGSVDGVNYFPIPMKQLNVASKLYVVSIVGTVVGGWVGSCAGFRKVRARVTAYTSGAATTTLTANVGIPDQSLDGLITSLTATQLGASGAATTLNVPAPLAGLRHYMTYLSINRFAAATLTAGAVPVAVSTTNLPGTLAFSFGAEALAQGQLDRMREDYAHPVAAVAQATATTIVCPATPNVIWRVTMGYYVAP